MTAFSNFLSKLVLRPFRLSEVFQTLYNNSFRFSYLFQWPWLSFMVTVVSALSKIQPKGSFEKINWKFLSNWIQPICYVNVTLYCRQSCVHGCKSIKMFFIALNHSNGHISWRRVIKRQLERKLKGDLMSFMIPLLTRIYGGLCWNHFVCL